MNDNLFYNFQTVLDAVPHHIDRLVAELIPDAKRSQGSYRAATPLGGRGTSFSISTKSNNAGCYLDHGDPSIKGNAISLVGLIKGMSYEQAGRWLAASMGVAPEERLHLPKKRPAPKIAKVDGTTIATVGKGQNHILPLNRKSVAYAESRGITRATLKAFQCASTDSEIVFPHFDEDGRLVMLKFWSCDGEKRICTNNDPVPVLFGKNLVDPVRTGGVLIITEGHWDALTWSQLGYPAVSIPSGTGNEEWVAEDWNFLNRFSHIYLDFDSDGPGREAEARVRTRLGHERCRSIRYRYKDANDALKAGDAEVLREAFKESEEAPIERILKSAELKDKVRNVLNRTSTGRGVPFFLPKLSFEFRPHEMTLWYGLTSHGKSTVLGNQIAYGASLGELALVASFEQATPMTLASMLVQYTSDPKIGSSPHYDEAFDELGGRVLFYDSMTKCNPRELVATMILAHRQLGINTFVVDNVMTLDVDRQDNTAQADVANQFRMFVARYPVHLHLVAHPRKPPDNITRPPSVAEIRGAAEWGDMPHNLIVIYRDVVKAENLSEMRDQGTSEMIMLEYENSMPDGKAIVRKQRDSGELPVVSYRFDRATKRAWKDIEDLMPYFVPKELQDLPAEAGTAPEESQSSHRVAEGGSSLA